MKLAVATKALVRRGDGRILVMREAAGYAESTQAGRYDVTGGRIHPGEAPLEALKREVREESGLEIADPQVFHVGDWKACVGGEDLHIIALYFKARALSENVRTSGDHDDARWIDPVEYHTLPLVENLADIFASYLASEGGAGKNRARVG